VDQSRSRVGNVGAAGKMDRGPTSCSTNFRTGRTAVSLPAGEAQIIGGRGIGEHFTVKKRVGQRQIGDNTNTTQCKQKRDLPASMTHFRSPKSNSRREDSPVRGECGINMLLLTMSRVKNFALEIVWLAIYTLRVRPGSQRLFEYQHGRRATRAKLKTD